MYKDEDFLEKQKKVKKTNICYFDEKGNIVDKEEATECIITEYDEEGNLINSIHAMCGNNLNKEEEER